MTNILFKFLIFTFPLLSVGCDKIKFDSSEKIKPIKTYSLRISEPSGLALMNYNLWIVSDRKSTVHRTNLEGKDEFSFKIENADLEGISIFNDTLLAIVKEISREVVITDFEGNKISQVSFEIDGSKNSGLEGISFNSSNDHFYLVNEKDPVLLIEADKNLKELNRIKIKNLKDVSGITYSKRENCLWLVSDEEKQIIKSSLEGKFITKYTIDVDQAEGITIDDENNLIYVVSDKEEKLYIFEIPQEK